MFIKIKDLNFESFKIKQNKLVKIYRIKWTFSFVLRKQKTVSIHYIRERLFYTSLHYSFRKSNESSMYSSIKCRKINWENS